MSTFDNWINAKVEEATEREERALEHMPKDKRLRDRHFVGYANALHKELVAIHYEGFTNNWTSVDIDRRVIQAIARRAYDLVKHAFEGVDSLTIQFEEVPDLTELPEEETEA